MKTVEVFACPDCERDLTAASLIHKKVPNTEGTCVCEFCKEKRYCAKYLVQIGRRA